MFSLVIKSVPAEERRSVLRTQEDVAAVVRRPEDGVDLIAVEELAVAPVLRGEAEAGGEASVERSHDRVADIGVVEAEAVSNLVSEGLQQVGAPPRVDGPALTAVHVNVSSVPGKVGVGQGSS